METKCKRCKAKESVFACMECDKFRFLCERCDDYIHNLPNKTKHKRIAIKQNDNNKQQKTIIAQAPSMYESMTKEENELNTHFNKQQDINEINQSNIEKDDIVNLSTNRGLNQSQIQLHSQSQLNGKEKEKTCCYSNEYSKNYLNELKSNYQKDKHDLLYQNNTILGMVDKLKESFSGQILSIVTEIGKYQSSTEEASFSLENRLNVKYANSLNEKEIEISRLKTTIADLEKHNNDLALQLTNAMQSFRQKETEYQHQIKRLETDILQQSEELFTIKGNLDEVVCHSSDKLSHETNSIKIEYEKRIQSILNEADKSRDSLLKVIEEREIDIRSLIETNRKQREDFNGIISGLKRENDAYRNQICEVLTQKNQLEEDKRYLSVGNNQMTNKTQEQDSIIAQIKEENEKLLQENVGIISYNIN